MGVAFGSPRLWMSLIFNVVTCALIDYFILGFDFIFRITLGKILQRLFNQRGELNDENNLPHCIADRINRYKTFEQQKVHNENEIAKIPQNSEYFPEDTKPEDIKPDDGYVGIKNISVNKQPDGDYIGINHISVNKQPYDGYTRINDITVNNGLNNNYLENTRNFTDDTEQNYNPTNSELLSNL